MWWKIYFWIVAVLTFIGTLALLFGFEGNSFNIFSFGDWIGYIIEIILLFGLYAFVFQKKTGSEQLWKLVVWIVAASYVVGFSGLIFPETTDKLLPFLKSNLPEIPTDEAVFYTLLSLPQIYAIYKLGYPQKKKSRK